jgi:hypothetical protein
MAVKTAGQTSLTCQTSYEAQQLVADLASGTDHKHPVAQRLSVEEMICIPVRFSSHWHSLKKLVVGQFLSRATNGHISK